MLYQIQFDLYNLKQGEMSIAQYYTKLNALWKDFDTLFLDIRREQRSTSVCVDRFFTVMKLTQFLIGLDSKHDGIRNQIQDMDESITVSTAYATLLNVEQQINKRQLERVSIHTDSAMFTKPNKYKSMSHLVPRHKRNN